MRWVKANASRTGHIRTWDRPKEDAGDASGLPNPFKS